MIDLHCHILPGVDDGSSSEEESCRMARLAVESGVTAVCATPHCNVPGCFDNYRTEALEERFLCLARLLGERDIPLRLYAGMEVYVTPETPRHLREGKLLTLGGSRYLLVEFGFEAPFSLPSGCWRRSAPPGRSLWWPTRNATVLRRRTGGAFSGG